MAKVLLIPFGAGQFIGEGKQIREYRKATYKIDEKLYETSYIGDALISHYKIDKTFYIGTSGSMWEELFRLNSTKKEILLDEDYYFYLVESIEQITSESQNGSIDLEKLEALLGQDNKCFQLKYGMNEMELFCNFEILFNIIDNLQDNDEIYVDITHSFRSLSLYMFIILNYIKGVTNKKITIKNISYGMFEVNREKNYVPVIDLNIMYKAIEWIKAADHFKEFGNAYQISSLLDETKDKTLIKKLNNFTDALNLSYVVELKKQIKTLESIKTNLNSTDGFGKMIIPKVIDDFLNRFSKYVKEEKEYLFQLEVAKFFYDKQMYSNAYLILHESIITYFIECDEEKKDKFCDEETRNLIKNKIRRYYDVREYKNDSDFKNLCEIYKTLTPIRNTIAHAIENGRVSSTDITNFNNIYHKKVNEIFKKNKKFYLFD